MKIELKAELRLTEEEYDVLVSASDILAEIANEMPEGNEFQRLASNASGGLDTLLTHYEEEVVE